MYHHFTFETARIDREVSDRRFHAREGGILIDSGPSPAGSHELGVFQDCNRKHYYTYVDKGTGGGDGGIDPLYLERGTLLHVGLAHHLALAGITEHGYIRVGDGILTRDDLPNLYPPVEAIHVAAAASLDRQRVLRESEEIYDKWRQWQAARVEEWSVLGVEVLMTLNALDGSLLRTARVDAVVKDRVTGRYHIVDHKGAYKPAMVAKLYGNTLQMHVLEQIGKASFPTSWGGVRLQGISTNREAFKVIRVPPDRGPAAVSGFPKVLDVLVAGVKRNYANKIATIPRRYGACASFDGDVCPFYARCGQE